MFSHETCSLIECVLRSMHKHAKTSSVTSFPLPRPLNPILPPPPCSAPGVSLSHPSDDQDVLKPRPLATFPPLSSELGVQVEPARAQLYHKVLVTPQIDVKISPVCPGTDQEMTRAHLALSTSLLRTCSSYCRGTCSPTSSIITKSAGWNKVYSKLRQ